MTTKVYSFKDIIGATVNFDESVLVIAGGAKHVIIPLRLAKEYLPSAVLVDLLAKPAIELVEVPGK